MNAAFLQDLGLQVRCTDWLIVTRRGRQCRRLDSGGRAAGRAQAGDRSRKKAGLLLQGMDLGDFLFGVLTVAAFITWRQYPQGLC